MTQPRGTDPRRLAIASGFGVAALFAAGNALWGLLPPEGDATPDQIVDFYASRATGIVVGGCLSLVSMAVLVLFISAIRALVAEHDDVLAATGFAGGLLLAATGVAAESINMAGGLIAVDGQIDGAVAQSVWEIARAFGSYGSAVGLGVFAVATAAAALRSGVLRRGSAMAVGALGAAVLTPLSLLTVFPGAVMIAVLVLISADLAWPRGMDGG